MNSESPVPPRVLIVDDDADVLDVLEETLNRVDGVEVVRATNGAEALDQLKVGAFNLLITDLDMENTGGIELLENAKTLAPAMPIIVVTGTQRARLLGRFWDLGIEAWFPKPFDPLEILDRVEELLALLKDQGSSHP